MELKELESEIRLLQRKLYCLAKESSDYSGGAILKLSETLDEKIILYQKLKINKWKNNY